MFLSQPPVIYVPQRHGLFHGPLTVLLVLWALALPAVFLLLTAFGPIGWLVGIGVAVVAAVPWLIGLAILWFLRHIA
jgi:hypothetical protein